MQSAGDPPAGMHGIAPTCEPQQWVEATAAAATADRGPPRVGTLPLRQASGPPCEHRVVQSSQTSGPWPRRRGTGACGSRARRIVRSSPPAGPTPYVPQSPTWDPHSRWPRPPCGEGPGLSSARPCKPDGRPANQPHPSGRCYDGDRAIGRRPSLPAKTPDVVEQTRGRRLSSAVHGQPTRITMSSFGPWAPSTRIRSMSPVRLGPVMNESMLGSRPA